MTFWSMPCRPEVPERDSSIYWHDIEDDQGEGSNDFFSQYVDFNTDAGPAATAPGHGANPPMPVLQDSMLFDQPHDGTGSSEVSTADDFDFLSNSSQAEPLASAGGHDGDPVGLSGKMKHQLPDTHHFEGGDFSRNCHQIDLEPPSLASITLQSPTKETPMAVSPQQFPSPTAVTAQKKPRRIVEALTSTIRKVTRSNRKPLPAQRARAASPTLDHPPRALNQPSKIGVANGGPPISPPDTAFIHGVCDDPFSDAVPPSRTSSIGYYGHNGLNTPADTPALGLSRSQSMDMSATHMPVSSWPLQPVPLAPTPDPWTRPEFLAGQEGWWDLNILGQPNVMGMSPQQPGFPYDYVSVADPSRGGLHIQMGQPQLPPATVYPPLPPPVPATERSQRPPRAPSAGARHAMGNAPVSPLKNPRTRRSSSASPTKGRSRQSSGGSVASVRSASGKASASMPGTPAGVRKRRPRDASGGDTSDGFINYGPSDGSAIMTGVAPSGSSKTKARREKEALEKSRRLSEAALKAVAAAGGDVERLVEQGFSY